MTWMKAVAWLGMGGAALGALASGCSSTPDETVPVDPLAKEEGFCTELAKVVCNATVVNACYGSVDSTREADTQTCVDNAATKFCNSDNAVYRAVDAQGCIDAYGAAYADAALDLADVDALAKACHATLSGNGATGGDCELDSDCNGALGLFCVAKPGALGTCQIPEEIGPGQSCAEAAQTCSDGFYCSEADLACIAERKAGQACSATQPCEDTARCDATSMMCVAKTGNGTDCTFDEACSGGFCDIAEGVIEGKCKAARPLNTTNTTCDNLLP